MATTTAITTPQPRAKKEKLKPKVFDPATSDDPNFARFPVNKSGGPITGRATRQVDWVEAPSTSHVQRFRLFDPRDPAAKPFLDQFGGKKAVLQIRFKATKTKGVTEYLYFFNSLSVAGRIWNEILNAEHPGEIVHYKLRLARVPYTRTV